MKTMTFAISDGTFLGSETIVSGSNSTGTHNVYVAFSQAESGTLAIQYKLVAETKWRRLGKVDLTGTEVAEFKLTGQIQDYRFVISNASGSGSIEVSDSEKLEDIHPLSFYGETGGMSPDEIGSAIASKPRAGVRIAFCGDSITDDSDAGASWNSWGWVSWFRRQYGRSLNIQDADIVATASMGTEHLLSVQLPAVLSGGYNAVFCMIGTNDLGSSVDIKGNLVTFYTALEKAGIHCYAIPILPHSDANSYTTEIAKQVDDINSFIAERCKNSFAMTFVNTLPAVTDYATGDAAAGILRDGIHTTRIGAKAVSDAVYSVVKNYIVDDNMNTEVLALYDATTNEFGNILTNPYFNGASGTLQNGVTGSAADTWSIRRDTPAATFSLAADKQARTDAVGQSQRLLPSGTGDGNSFTITSNNFYPTGLETGDIVEMEFEVEVSGLTGIGYDSARLAIGTTYYYDGYPSQVNGDCPSDFSCKYIVRGEYVAGESVSARMTFRTNPGATLSGQIVVKYAGLRKVR